MRALQKRENEGSVVPVMGLVSHLWFGFEFGKISPKTSIFFLPGQKKSLRVGSESTWVNGMASYLLRIKSKLRLGRVRAHKWYVAYRS